MECLKPNRRRETRNKFIRRLERPTQLGREIPYCKELSFLGVKGFAMDTPESVIEFCVKMRKSCLILPEDSSASRTI